MMILSNHRNLIKAGTYLCVLMAMAKPLLAAEKNEQKLTEVWQPIPKKVDVTRIPSDAISLLQSQDQSASDKWQHTDHRQIEWSITNGELTVKPGTGSIMSKQSFCDMQMHLEWRSPNKPGMKRANSGIKIQERYELQILDTYGDKIYVNGQAGSVYKQAAPLVNAEKPSGEWQVYDIIYKAPKFDEAGKLIKPAYITALLNGVLIQDNFEIKGTTLYIGQPQYFKPHGCKPILLQDHGNEVSFRNIWVREL